jgi:hypothetical protein
MINEDFAYKKTLTKATGLRDIGNIYFNQTQMEK